MDLTYGSEYDPFRRKVREFLDEHKDDAPRAGIGSGEAAANLLAWQKVLVEHGYAARTVPKEYGGYGADPDLIETIIIAEEFQNARVAQGVASQGISMFVPTLLQYGTEEQKRAYIGPTISGEMIWCQGYSEPGAGSDLASIQTSAVLDGDDFVINGQKIWTSTAKESSMMFALVRTEPDESKHKGISYLVLPTDSEGLDIRPLKTMTGASSFNEVFFENVRVPKKNLIGVRGQGWEIGTATLVHERNMLGSTRQTETMLLNCSEVLRDYGKLGDPVFRDRLMAIQGRVVAMKYHSLRMLTDKLRKRSSGKAGLITKLNGCQINHDICALAIDAMDEVGMLRKGSKHVRERGMWQSLFMFSLGLIIGGGTAQIQKNIISERGLGMPREPKPAPRA